MTKDKDFSLARQNMVSGQLRPLGIRDERILEAMSLIPREQFVPQTHKGVAYIDDNIKLLSNRFMLRPLILAKLLEIAQIQPTDKVLELGTATGYSTRVLAELSAHIVSIESDVLLHQEAKKNLSETLKEKVILLAGASVEGCIDQAPFDIIFINGIIDFIPKFLFEQLKNKGHLVCIMRTHQYFPDQIFGQARVYRKTDETIEWQDMFETTAPYMPSFKTEEHFQF